eukprot:TRINITY_DN10318_c0_g1_i1.p1 TRINITY_DN10318_c0_g1~~TRINITY_DN10318_c0_g1_i1.p1  ORF type:complete len:440 (+),score=124.03 TRINITY_DN10318_c0_g1_i1:146-1321(+)
MSASLMQFPLATVLSPILASPDHTANTSGYFTPNRAKRQEYLGLSPRSAYLGNSGAARMLESALVAMSEQRPEDPRSWLAEYFRVSAEMPPSATPADCDRRVLELNTATAAEEVLQRQRRRSCRFLFIAAAACEQGAAPLNIPGRQHRAPLTPESEQQAAALAARLARQRLPVAEVFCSPHLRARRTAELLAEALPRPRPAVRAATGLRERCMGALTGKVLTEVIAQRQIDEMEDHGIFWRPPGTSPEDGALGESEHDLECRIGDVVEDILAPADAGTAGADRLSEQEHCVAVVTHPSCIRAFLRGVLGAAAHFRWRCADPPPCSITEVTYDSRGLQAHRGWRLVRFADTAHTEDLPPLTVMPAPAGNLGIAMLKHQRQRSNLGGRRSMLS